MFQIELQKQYDKEEQQQKMIASEMEMMWCDVMCLWSRDKMPSNFHMIWKILWIFGDVYTAHIVRYCVCDCGCHDVKVKEYQAAVKFGHLKCIIMLMLLNQHANTMIYSANEFFSLPLFSLSHNSNYKLFDSRNVLVLRSHIFWWFCRCLWSPLPLIRINRISFGAEILIVETTLQTVN